MRRLPIYFLIDVSESMVGDQIDRVQEGIGNIIRELKKDPIALETVYVSILIFAGEAKTIVPLQDIISFYPPKIPIGSGTALHKGLGHLMHELRVNQIKTTREQKGDWKPIVFLFTDGTPTDNPSGSIAEWKANWSESANLIAVSLGEGADLNQLSELTENLIKLENTNQDGFASFFKWVTASIKSSSESIEKSDGGLELADIPTDDMTAIDLKKGKAKYNQVDDNFVVLSALCQNTKKNYLMKYRRVVSDSGFEGIELQSKSYKLVGAYRVDDVYHELSDASSTQFKVNTEELIGTPTCPSCGNQIAFAVCQCGQIHCLGDEKSSTCPKCGNQGEYGASGGFDVNRTQG